MLRLLQALVCAVHILLMVQTADSQFSVARTSSLPVSTYPRLLYEEDILGQSDFDLVSSTYTVPQTGVYWIHISAGIPPSTEADVRLNLPYYQPDIVRSHVNFYSGIDTTSRCVITNLTQGHQLYLNSIYTSYSDFLLQVSFGGFSIDTYMSQTVAFFLASSFPQTTIGNITFDTVVLDTDGGWSEDDEAYIVKAAGIYVISFTTGLSRNAGQTVRALVNGDVSTAIFVTDTAHGGEDTATLTFLADLAEDDSLQLVLSRGTVYSDIRHLTAFNGFLYAPRGNLVAWQLYRTADLEGPADPVSFDIVVLDTADQWNPSNSRYTVGTAGVYCINLNAGMVARIGMGLSVMINQFNEMAVYRSSVNHNGFDTRGRSLIVRLAQGDQLRVSLAVSFELESSEDLRQTSFSGFRIY